MIVAMVVFFLLVMLVVMMAVSDKIDKCENSISCSGVNCCRGASFSSSSSSTGIEDNGRMKLYWGAWGSSLRCMRIMFCASWWQHPV